MLLSLSLEDGMLHVLGTAVRSVRGDDGRWYVAAEFDEVELLDRSRLDRMLEPAEQESGSLVDAHASRERTAAALSNRDAFSAAASPRR